MSSKKKCSMTKSNTQFCIDAEHCFCGMNFTVKEMQEAMDAYQKKKKSNSDWLYVEKIPIFVDANVLLNVYFSPVPLRQHLARFLTNNKDRLYITSQVEKEFMRHRLQFIDKYKNKLKGAANIFRNSYNAFDIDFKAKFGDLKNTLVDTNFIDCLPQTNVLLAEVEELASNDLLFNDSYKRLLEKVQNLKNKFEEEYHVLYNKVDIEYKDPILKEISELNILKPLSSKEYDFTKTLYEQLSERYGADKDKYAPYLRFPGSGEKKDLEIKKEPWGDLVIYHQILVFMAESHKDVIFLTNDKSKLDWMKKEGEPYSYYIADAYKNTKQTLFVISVNDFLPKDYASVDETLIDEDSIGLSNKVVQAGIDPFTGSSREQISYKEITSEQFLSELRKYSQWTEKYGENYVSQSYFIYVVLGQQGYRFSKSMEMLNKLVENEIEVYEKEKNGSKITCIRLKE